MRRCVAIAIGEHGMSEDTVKMQSPAIDDLIDHHTSLTNPDGTENQVAVHAVNQLGATLATRFGGSQTGARRRTTLRRVRRRTGGRTRYVRRR